MGVTICYFLFFCVFVIMNVTTKERKIKYKLTAWLSESSQTAYLRCVYLHFKNLLICKCYSGVKWCTRNCCDRGVMV